MADTATPAADLFAGIVEQRRRVVALREHQEREMRAEKRKLAALLVDARDHPDPAVHQAAAAERMGVNKNYVGQLIRAFETGDLDDQ